MRTKKPLSPLLAVALLAFAFSCDLQSDLYANLLDEIGFTVTVNASVGGKVVPDGPVLTNQNPLRIKAIPDPGFELDSWNCDGMENLKEPKALETTLRLVTDGMLVTANFIASTVGVITDGGGMIIAGGGQIIPGSPMTIVAEAFPGYVFTGWTKVEGKGAPVFANAALASTSVTVTGGSCVIQANFTTELFTITVPAAINGGTISLNPAGPYHFNDVVLISVFPDPDYEFIGWGGVLSGTETPLAFTVTENVSLTATFAFVNYVAPANFLVTTGSTTGTTGASTFSMVWDAYVVAGNSNPIYEVERSTDLVDWTNVYYDYLPSFTDTGLDHATTYYYRARVAGSDTGSWIPGPWSPVRAGVTLRWNGSASVPVFVADYASIYLDPYSGSAPTCPVPPPGGAWKVESSVLQAGGYTYFIYGYDSPSPPEYIEICIFDSAGQWTSQVWQYSGYGLISAMTFLPATGAFTITGTTGALPLNWTTLNFYGM